MKQKFNFPWWLIFIFTCALSWVSVLVAGIMVKNKKWIIAGIIYAVPFFLLFSTSDTEEQVNKIAEISSKFEAKNTFSKSDSAKYSESILLYDKIRSINDSILNLSSSDKKSLKKAKELRKKKEDIFKDFQKSIKKANPQLKDSAWTNFVIAFWLISILAAIIHALIIIKPYSRQYNERQSESSENQKKYKEKRKKESKKQQFLNEVEEIQNAILNRIEKSDNFDAFIVDDIKEMTFSYSKQIKKLLDEDEKLKMQLQKTNIPKLKKEIDSLSEKLRKEDSSRLIKEYQNALDSKQKLYESQKEIEQQHKTVLLRLESAISSLKQVEYDLIKLENVFSTENKEQFFKSFGEKSSELSDYVTEVEKAYKEFR